jgi:deferrochelatase/peroxidase EfeB
MAFRYLEQDTEAFESFIHTTGERFHMDPEMVAAKMVGRWRDGTPLALSPDASWTEVLEGAPEETPNPLDGPEINEFDHAATADHPANYDDYDGVRCPFGSHMRRMNPRGGPVMGMQHNHRIVRRGIPYGPEYVPGQVPDDESRSLLGAFICGSLENQFEFLQSVWANLDIAAPDIRGSRDPIIGWQPEAGGDFSIPTCDT